MSVVSAAISKVCTAHASDSFITERKADGTYHVRESKQSKIVQVPRFRGAMAYWGLAQFDAPRWSTRKWLAERAQQTGKSSGPEKFAKDLAGDLTAELLKLKLTGSTGGIGIHFTAYESINGYWIPELFLISNWADTYTELRCRAEWLCPAKHSTAFPGRRHTQATAIPRFVCRSAPSLRRAIS